ncbi:MAG: sporulation protein YqfD [Candidatus Ventricola sp.]|nr:sporulation protein YqfD [Candidatus Ventricola sp.]
MSVVMEITGLNLEKLMRAAAQEGLVLRDVRREEERAVRVRVSLRQMKALRALCGRYGWELRELHAGALLRAGRFLAQRRMLAVAALLCPMLVYASSQMLLCVCVEGAGENAAAVREELRSAGAVPFRIKGTLSTDALRARLEYALPGLVFAGVRFEGSTLVVDCRRAREGESLEVPGTGLDLVASEPGIVTRLWVQSGTPLVEAGQAICAGQVLVRGQERTQAGGVHAVQAQGQVMARVWARGDARVRLWEETTVETGQTRSRVTLCTPWQTRVVKEAEPFVSQDASVSIEPLVGLYLPVYRKTETYAETVVFRSPRDSGEATRRALGAAEEIAKNSCPAGAETLDKWTKYSMIDNEFVYATVVIEYERDIASRTP